MRPQHYSRRYSNTGAGVIVRSKNRALPRGVIQCLFQGPPPENRGKWQKFEILRVFEIFRFFKRLPPTPETRLVSFFPPEIFFAFLTYFSLFRSVFRGVFKGLA